ncbi:GntR family transcriptional regulator [Scatolibacter rhodanostii]|uniref:GntR family transcriptional regulator n=1 Tax=Scatolibacter rhodanostii TaxID=2014781 RepID=UPI001A9A3BF5|nr:GntR family transcriptional regulator [Scatolibacter rhodanostii]
MKDKPKYLQLFEQIKSEILQGVYVGGQKIPGENETAEKYGMSRQTVRQALAMLEQEQFVERKQGSGTYIKESKKERKKTWRVGVIATYISEYIFPSILRGMESELTENGFSMMLNATGNRVDSERAILEEYLKKPVDGLIVEGTKTALPNPNLSLYEKLEKKGIPVVFFNGYYPQNQEQIYVVMNDKRGGYQAVSHLISKGHKKIAGIFKNDDRQGLNRYAGYLEALIEHKLPIQDEWVIWFNSENRRYLLADEGARVIQSLQDCTAVVCYNDEIAVKLVNLLKSCDKEVPQDMAVISFDHSLFSDLSAVPLTSLNHPKEVLGSVAARKLLNMMEGREESSLVMEWGFSSGKSTEGKLIK